MPFECARCGECCSHLGLVFRIQEDRGDHRFLLLNRYNGEKTEVAIDSDKIPLFSDTSTFSREPEACPFFRTGLSDRKGYCIVHSTRPAICRDFSCWHVQILDSGGRRVGRIMFARTLVSDDPAFLRLIEERIEPLRIDDDHLWIGEVIRIAETNGYVVRT